MSTVTAFQTSFLLMGQKSVKLVGAKFIATATQTVLSHRNRAAVRKLFRVVRPF
jgi:hypothetical protein